MKKLPVVAIAYDFDGTLASGNMQEINFLPAIGMSKKKFWAEVSTESKEHEADNILMYMHLMLEKAESSRIPVRKQDIMDYGKSLSFYNGVLPYRVGRTHKKGWFDRINQYGKESGVKLEHYIISSGIKEMVLGSPIGKKFKAVYASSFYYDHNGIAKWPALAINYTSKTQFLFRINKGCLTVHEHEEINKFIPEEKRAIPFENMIYLGDGDTDVPCFRIVKDLGGHSIAVYKPHTQQAKENSMKYLIDGRVNFITPADYTENSPLDLIITSLIDKISQDSHIKELIEHFPKKDS